MDHLICLICVDSATEFTTRCNHNLHLSCLESWLENTDENEKIACPLCRQTILGEKKSLTVEKFNELSLETAKLLIHVIAEKNNVTLYNNNLETLAAYVKILNFDKNDRLDLLHRACKSGNLNLIKILIEENAEKIEKYNYGITNSVDINGTYLLHKACLRGYLGIVKLLIDNGAEVNAVDNNGGHTPLSDACWVGHLEIVKLLIDNGAEVNAVDNNNGDTS